MDKLDLLGPSAGIPRCSEPAGEARPKSKRVSPLMAEVGVNGVLGVLGGILGETERSSRKLGE